MSGGASAGGFAEGSKGKSKQKNRVQIPEWMMPFVQQSLGTASTALGGLENQIVNRDLVADFTPEQMQGFQQALDIAGGGGGFLPAAQQAFMGAAQGGSTLDPAVQQQYQDTLGGKYLYGGEGFDAAVQAAVNAATPQIASAFGGSAGGLSGGLARQAVGDTAVDAFARQYGQERMNQMAAASNFGQFNQADAARQLQAAGQLPGLAMMPSDIYRDIGGAYQGQAQDELSGPIDAYSQLLNSALGAGGSFGNYLGSNTRARTQTFAHGIQGSGGKG
jgi:hypothetical protein